MRSPYGMRGFPGEKSWPLPPFNGKKITPAVRFGDFAPLSRGEGGRPAREPPRLQEDCKKRFFDPKKRLSFFRVSR